MDRLGAGERPGGFARNHRKVRRQEELIWLSVHGFTHVVSLLDSPHNLHAYDEAGLAYVHVPLGPHDELAPRLEAIYAHAREAARRPGREALRAPRGVRRPPARRDGRLPALRRPRRPRHRTRSRSSRSSPAAASAPSAARSSPSPSTTTSTASTAASPAATVRSVRRGRLARCRCCRRACRATRTRPRRGRPCARCRRRVRRRRAASSLLGRRCRRADRERAHSPHEAEPAEHFELDRRCRDRHRRPERGDAARGRAALGRAHDRGDAEILGRLHRRVRDRPRDPVVVVGGGGARGRRCALRGQPSAASATSAIVRTVSVGVRADRGLLRQHRARRCRRAPRWRRRSPRRASAAASGSSTRASASR